MSRTVGLSIWITACALFLLAPEARAYRAADFHWLPPFLAMEDKPSLTFILDTYIYNADGDSPHFVLDNASEERHGHEPTAFDFDDTQKRPDLADQMSHMTRLRSPVTVKAEHEKNLFRAISNKARVALITFEDGEAKRHPATGYADDLENLETPVNSVNAKGDVPLAKILSTANEILRQNSELNAKAADQISEQTAPCSRQRVILVSDTCGARMDSTNQEKMGDASEALQNADFYVLCLDDSSSSLSPGVANFYTADSWSELATAITRRSLIGAPVVASGTAPTVSIQTRSGEGAAYQAVFYPPVQTNQTAPPWSGQVHAYLLDAQGNLREDTNANQQLDMTADRVIEFAGESIFAHTDADGNGVIDDEERNATALGGMGAINFLWSTSKWLNGLTDEEAITQRPTYASTDKRRYILTFVDKNRDMMADGDNGEIQHFALPAKPAEATLNSPEHFYNFLTLYESGSGTPGLDRSAPTQNAIHKLREGNPSGFSTFKATLAKRQMDFIRGAEVGNATLMEAGNATDEKLVDKVRSRTHQGTTWRLGDIVYSSPTAVGMPAENYHLIYNDRTYEKFLKQYLHRRQVIYVGANDGMLHAFNGGFWNAGARSFGKAGDGRTEFELGQELWAYVPYNLLPHLKWLMLPEYGENLHVAYMDLTPKVFDARIFGNDDKHPGGWGTILVAGMRLGGAAMEVDIDKTDGNTFKEGIDRSVTSAYVIMDVTDPESAPNVLAEISLPGQGFTTCVPAVMPMSSPNAKNLEGTKWYLVFGSGPADDSGRAESSKLMHPSSDQAGRLFVLDLSALITEKTVKTVDSTGLISPKGAPFAYTDAESFISDPVCVDLAIPSKENAGKFSTDLVYFGTVAGESASPAGKVYRLRTCNGPPEGWRTSTLIDVGEPVSAAPSVTVDEKGSLWVYFGTGRFFNRDDIFHSNPMGFYGIREPETGGAWTWDTVHAQLLFDSSKVAVTQGTCGEGEFSDNCVGITQMNEDSRAVRDWAWLTKTLDQAPGWKHPFSAAGERVLEQAAILGGTVVFTSFIPAQEICSAGGTSNLWSLYYKTGTPFFWPSLDHPTKTIRSFVELGPGPAAKPILHIGENHAVTNFNQLTSGELKHTEITPPFPFKSGCLFWRKNTE